MSPAICLSMFTRKHIFILAILFIVSCSLWDYDDPSMPVENQAPETFLSLVATDTIYASQDSVTGEWIYYLENVPENDIVLDTLTHAFSTVTTSEQTLSWWGEDSDGDIIGYWYRWNVDSVWTFTSEESGIFFVPIRKEIDVFTFEVRAIDSDSLTDFTPAKIVLPIHNSSPQIEFRYQSNPLLADIPTDTSFTFPTRTFVWDVQDLDGVETIIDLFYALDDSSDSNWVQLEAASYSSITLTNIDPGFHTFYIKARDIAGAESDIARFPDFSNVNEPNYWKVMPVNGEVLIVDDFTQDSQNNALNWYKGVVDDILGENQCSVWEIGDKLPYSSADISANLNYFNHVIWFTAYTGIETFPNAGAHILNYVLGGGNLFLNAIELKDTTYPFFPLDSTFVLNTNGRLISGRTLMFQDSTDMYEDMDLETSRLIAIRVKGFEPANGDTIDNSMRFTAEDLYWLQEPEGSTDTWTGTPNVCSRGQFQWLSSSEISGDIVLLTIPLHNGNTPLLEGNGSASKFIDYLLSDVFSE